MQAQNNFIGGLNTDINKYNVPNNVLTDCINGITITNNGNEFVLQNRNSNSFQTTLTPGFIPLGITEYGGISYIISYNPKTKEGEIGSVPSPLNEQSDFLTNDVSKLQTLDSYVVYKDRFINPNNIDATALNEQVFKEPVKVYLWKVTKDNMLNPGDVYAIMYKLMQGAAEIDIEKMLNGTHPIYRADVYLEVNNRSIKLSPSNGFYPNLKVHNGLNDWTDLVYNANTVKPYIHNNSGRYYITLSVKDMAYFDIVSFEETTDQKAVSKVLNLQCKGDINTECKFRGVKIKLQAFDVQNVQVDTIETFVDKNTGENIVFDVTGLNANFFSRGPGYVLYEITPFSKYNINFNLTKKGRIPIKQFISESTNDPIVDTFNITEAGLKFRINQLGNILAGNENKIERCYIEFYDVFADVSTIYTVAVPNTNEVTLPLTITDKAYGAGKIGGFYDASEIKNVTDSATAQYKAIVKFTNNNVSSTTTLAGTKFIRDKAFYLVKLTFQAYDYENSLPIIKDFVYFRTISVNTAQYVRDKDIHVWWNTNKGVSHSASFQENATTNIRNYTESLHKANDWLEDQFKLNGQSVYTRGKLYSSIKGNTSGSNNLIPTDDSNNVIMPNHSNLDASDSDHKLQFAVRGWTGDLENVIALKNKLVSTIPPFYFNSDGKILNELANAPVNASGALKTFNRTKNTSSGVSTIDPSSYILSITAKCNTFPSGAVGPTPTTAVKEVYQGLMLLGQEVTNNYTFLAPYTGLNASFLEPVAGGRFEYRVFEDYGLFTYKWNSESQMKPNMGGLGSDMSKYQYRGLNQSAYTALGIQPPYNDIMFDDTIHVMGNVSQIGKVWEYESSLRQSMYVLSLSQDFQLNYNVSGQLTNQNMLTHASTKMKDVIIAKIDSISNSVSTYKDILADSVKLAFPIVNLDTTNVIKTFTLSGSFNKGFNTSGWVTSPTSNGTWTMYLNPQQPMTSVTTEAQFDALPRLTQAPLSNRRLRTAQGLALIYENVYTQNHDGGGKAGFLNHSGNYTLRTKPQSPNTDSVNYHKYWDSVGLYNNLLSRYTTWRPYNGAPFNAIVKYFHYEGSAEGGAKPNFSLSNIDSTREIQPVFFNYL